MSAQKLVFWGVRPQGSEDDTPVARGCSRSTVGIPQGCRGRSSTGNWRWPGSVRGAHTKRRGLCGRPRNVPALTYLKRLFDVQRRFCLLPVINTEEVLRAPAWTHIPTCNLIQTRFFALKTFSQLVLYWSGLLLHGKAIIKDTYFVLLHPSLWIYDLPIAFFFFFMQSMVGLH